MIKLLISVALLACVGILYALLQVLAEKAFPQPEDPAGEQPAAEGADEGRLRAVVHCTGGGVQSAKYRYQGLRDCLAAAQAPGGGPLGCDYGCLGMGSCERVCPTGAIRVQNGVAVVEGEKCTACGKCLEVCPRHIITLETFRPKQHVSVLCSSHAGEEAVTAVCSDGCVGCGLCAEGCPQGAIQVEDGLARIDGEKCDHCGVCALVCPRRLIRVEKVAQPPEPKPQPEREPPKPKKERPPKPPRKEKEPKTVKEPKAPKAPKEPKEPREPKKPKEAKPLKLPKLSLPTAAKTPEKEGAGEGKKPKKDREPEKKSAGAAKKAPSAESTEERESRADRRARKRREVKEAKAARKQQDPRNEGKTQEVKTSEEAFKAFEQAVAAAGEALEEKKQD